MQRLVAGDSTVEEAREPLDRCLGCRACETACPSDVQYGQLLEIARDGGAQTPSVQVRALLSFVRRPRLLALALRAGRPLARLLPGATGSQRGVARSARDRDLGTTAAGRAACRRAARLRHARGLRRCRSRPRSTRSRPPATTSSPAPSRAAAARFTCTTASWRRARACASSCSRACPTARSSSRPRRAAARPCASATSACSISARRSCGRPRRRRAAAAGRSRCSTPATSCTPSGVREAPRELLRGAGYEPVELAGAGRCCGAAGVYAFTQPELSQQLAQQPRRCDPRERRACRQLRQPGLRAAVARRATRGAARRARGAPRRARGRGEPRLRPEARPLRAPRGGGGGVVASGAAERPGRPAVRTSPRRTRRPARRGRPARRSRRTRAS